MLSSKDIRNAHLVLFFLLIGSFYLAASNANSGDREAILKTEEDKFELERIESSLGNLASQYSILKDARRDARTLSEKRVIRQEMKRIKHEMQALEARGQALNGGIYFGSGALVVILLLILLL